MYKIYFLLKALINSIVELKLVFICQIKEFTIYCYNVVNFFLNKMNLKNVFKYIFDHFHMGEKLHV